MSAWMRVAIIARRAGRTRYSRSQLLPQACPSAAQVRMVFHKSIISARYFPPVVMYRYRYYAQTRWYSL